MLDCTADSNGNIKVRSNNFAGLANLQVVWHEASIYGGS
jgi:hypothetical protein